MDAGEARRARQRRRGSPQQPGPGLIQDMLAKICNPGVEGQTLLSAGAAKFIPAGSDIVFEVHYKALRRTGNGRLELVDRVSGWSPAISLRDYYGREQQPGLPLPRPRPHFEVKAESTVQREVKLVWLQPHMHYRAKGYRILRAISIRRAKIHSY